MTDRDSDEDRTQVDPAEFETFDKYDPTLDPPEVPDAQETDPDPTLPFERSVPAGTVEATIAVLCVAYNKQ